MSNFNTLAPQIIGRLASDLKLTPQQAAGIVGQLGHESAGLQAINETKPVVPGSRGGFGWAQWTGPRRRQFESWAAEKKMDVKDPEANYGFLLHELTQTPEARVLDQIRSAPDAQAAGRVFTDKFLRPGVPAYESRQSWTDRALSFVMPTAHAAEVPQRPAQQSNPKPWREVVNSEGYQRLSAQERARAQQQYFEQVVAPKVPEGQLGQARGQFFGQYKLESQDGGEQSFVEQAGSALREIPRQIGLTARYGMEGLGQAAQLATEPIRQMVVNPAARAVGLPEAAPTGTVMADLADMLGLPKPQGANERVVGDVTRMMAGGGGLAGGAGALARGASGVTQGALQAFAANPAQQVASAAGAGGFGGAVREAGGGPLEQAVAGLAGGLAGPLALHGAQQVAGSVARRLPTPATSPERVDQRIEIALKQTGADWSKVPDRIKAGLRQEVSQALRQGDDLSPAALRRLLDFKTVEGSTPTRGMLSLDPVQITRERNLAKSAANSSDRNLQGLARVENTNNQALISTLNQAGAGAADDAYVTGDRVIRQLQSGIDARKGAVDSLYSAARDTSGRSLPLSGAAFANRVIPDLDQAMVGGALPADVRNHINKISMGEVPFTVEYAEQLKTAIGKLQRSTSDGQTRYALGIVRNALDDTPLLNEATAPGVSGLLGGAGNAGEEAIKAFNQARSANRQMMQWIESSPAIKAVYEGSATPDQFVSKFIVGQSATAKDLAALRDAVKQSPEVAQGVRSYIAAHLKDKALGGSADEVGNFSAAGYNRALKSIGTQKLSAFFSPEEIEQLKAIGRVSSYMTVQPKGSAVNNSNSGALLIGRGLDVLDAIGSKIPLLGIGQTIQGTISGVQQNAATQIAPSLLNAVPRLSLGSTATPATVYGGLLGLPAVPPRKDDRRP